MEGKGDGIKSRQPSKILLTLKCQNSPLWMAPEREYNNGQLVYLLAIMVVRKKRVHSPFLRYASFVLFSAYLPHSTSCLNTLVFLITDLTLIQGVLSISTRSSEKSTLQNNFYVWLFLENQNPHFSCLPHSIP